MSSPRVYADRILPQEDLGDAPPLVAAANAAAGEAFAAFSTVHADMLEAELEANRAPTLDRDALKLSMEQDKPQPEPITERARAAAERAEVVAGAAEDLLKDRLADLDRAIVNSHQEWAETEGHKLIALCERAAAAVPELGKIFVEVEAQAALAFFPRQYESGYPKSQTLLRRDPRRRLFNESNAKVYRRPAELLAALAEVSGEYPELVGIGSTELEDRVHERDDRAARRQAAREGQAKKATTAGIQS